jgi:hypothetical protein
MQTTPFQGHPEAVLSLRALQDIYDQTGKKVLMFVGEVASVREHNTAEGYFRVTRRRQIPSVGLNVKFVLLDKNGNHPNWIQ